MNKLSTIKHRRKSKYFYLFIGGKKIPRNYEIQKIGENSFSIFRILGENRMKEGKTVLGNKTNLKL